MQIKNKVLSALLYFPLVALADHGSVGLGVGSAAPISTESGLTLPENKWAIGYRSEYIKFNEFSDTELQHLREEGPDADLHSVKSFWSHSIAAAYGVTDDFTVGIRLPYISRSNIREPAHGHGHEEAEGAHGDEPADIENLGHADGLGDAIFYGQYRIFQQENSHLSVLLGVKTPTGETKFKTSDGEVLETEFQPGSGSWDGLFGLAFTQKVGDFSLDTSLVYSLVTEGSQQTDLGDVISYNAALSYRLMGGETLSYIPPKYGFDLVLEMNGEWRDMKRVAAEYDNNSGGNILYISPGIRFIAQDLVSFAVSVGLPVTDGFNGDQVNPDYRIIGNVNFNF